VDRRRPTEVKCRLRCNVLNLRHVVTFLAILNSTGILLKWHTDTQNSTRVSFLKKKYRAMFPLVSPEGADRPVYESLC